MNEKRVTILLGVLGLVTSFTLLLAIAFAELRGRETLTTKIKQVEETQAAQVPPTNPPLKLQKTSDEILNAVDRHFNSEPVMQNIKEE